MVAPAGLLDDLELLVGRERDVDDLQALVVEQLAPARVHGLDAVALGDGAARAPRVREAIAATE